VSSIPVIFGIFTSVLKGIVTNLFHPLYGLGHALTVFAFALRYELIPVNNYDFAIDFYAPQILIPLIGGSAWTVFWTYLHLFDKDRKIVRMIGLSTLPIAGTCIFLFSYMIGVMSIWMSIMILESETPPDDFLLFSFSAWAFFMSWYMRQLLIGSDGKSGEINRFFQFLYRKFPTLEEYNKKLMRKSAIFLTRIFQYYLGPQKILKY